MIEAVLMLACAGEPVPAVDRALALSGGAIILPMDPASAEDGWPQSMQVHLEGPSGRRTLTGHLVWRTPQPAVLRHWGADPVPAILVPIRAGYRVVDPSDKGVGPRMIIALPSEAGGDLTIGGKTVHLHWAPLPETMPDLRLRSGGPMGPPPPFKPSEATPGTLPLERWRWELLCAADGVHPPPLPPPGLDRDAALASVGPWRFLMHALAEADRGVAREVLDCLTRRVERDGRVIADWVSDPGRIAALVQGQSGQADLRAQAALAWAESMPPITTWIEQPLHEDISVVLSNATVRARVVEVAWARPGEIPVGIGVEAGTVAIERLARGPDEGLIAMQTGAMATGLKVPPASIAPRPPGLSLGPFLGPLTLRDAQAGQQPAPPPPDRQTWAQVRRVLGRWEILLDCARPAGAPASIPPAGAMTVDRLKGHDAVLIRLEVDGQGIPIVVHPSGWTCARGAVPRLEVRTARRGDAWISRVLLPEHWTGDGFSIELTRTHGGDDAIETAVSAGSPWAPLPGPLHIDVTAWDD
ncbi:MAG: hypothetical protein MK101_01730 [Phycisphaerales bacterium]|nr:hypothetical protein [Phycisphaerales bacterium]